MKNVVKYTYGEEKIIEVISINDKLIEDTFYFDYQDFKSEIVDLVELVTGSTEYKLVKVNI